MHNDDEVENLLFEDIIAVLQPSPRATMGCRKLTIAVFSLDSLSLFFSIVSC